jgi:hypothetical protein
MFEICSNIKLQYFKRRNMNNTRKNEEVIETREDAISINIENTNAKKSFFKPIKRWTLPPTENKKENQMPICQL